MPYMREFFHEKLQLPIEFFNPLQNVTVSGIGGSTGGDAFRPFAWGTGWLGPPERSHMSDRVESAPAKRGAEEGTGKTAAVFHCGGCLFPARIARLVGLLRASGPGDTAKHGDSCNKRTILMRADETRLNKLKKDVASLDTIATPLIAAVNDRNFWPEILEDLNSRLPEADIWITELAATSGGKVLGTSEKRTVEKMPDGGGQRSAGSSKTKGLASGPAIDGILVRGLYLYNSKQQEIVVDYFRNLATSPFFTIDPKTPERVIKSNSVPNDTEWAFPYELQLTLRKPVKMP